ncbi:hypothetical protein [Hymenobacter negativus]|uniref:Uncharacterized protein n=1 Tax=Hymenobacter negativus TaxID=2795026 RepID=A0ABS3Q9P4_9BACT|nr:hypothetical protein [Hymenobacter negativus]MBO2007882.1 hypothetical protein [Hymenobacter negativus]
MEVRIDTNYSPAEIQELCAMLVSSGVVTPQEMAREEAFFQGLELDFLSINNLLLPFWEKFVGHSMVERDLAIRLHGHDAFYRPFTQRLLDRSPLGRHAPRCTIAPHSGELTVRAGEHAGGFLFRTYPDYLAGVSRLLNSLFHQEGADAAYHPIGFDEAVYFLLLTESQYQYLLTHRVLLFRGVEYPEIEAWRATLTDEDRVF